MVIPQIDQTEIVRRLDLSIASRVDLVLSDRKIANQAVATVAQNRFEEACLEGSPEIEDAKASRGIAPARIAEPAISEWSGKALA